MWTVNEIAGRAAETFEPDTTAGTREGPRPVVLFLHGLDPWRPSTSAIWTAALEQHGAKCVCPGGGGSWWLDRLSGEFDPVKTPVAHLVDDVVPWIAERWDVSPPLVGLMGVGMGGQGALQLAYRRARDFPVVAALNPAVDFHLLHGHGGPLDEMFADREAARQETAILHVHPLNWPRHQLLACDRKDVWAESLEKLASKLFSSGIPFDSETEITGNGNTSTYLDAIGPRAIAYVVERLEKESRRLV